MPRTITDGHCWRWSAQLVPSLGEGQGWVSEGWGEHLTSFRYDTYPTPCPSPEMGGELLRIVSALATPLPFLGTTLYTHLYRQYNRQRIQRFQCLAEKTARRATRSQPRATPWVSYYRQCAPHRGKRIDHLHLGKIFCLCRALVTHDHSTQGVALGWLLLAFQADYFRCV